VDAPVQDLAMKRVLFLAFYFPPRNNIACYRAGCFAKYLPEYGWAPTVLCQDWPLDRPDSDPEFVGSLPDAAKVHRVPAPAENGFYERVVLRKMAPYLWPHRSPILWWRNARQRMLGILQTTRFDAILATSDPLTPLALAAEASSVTRLRWIADMRDCLNVQRFGSWYKRPFFRHQERRLCRKADHVVTVSEGLAGALRGLSKKPVSVIYNGFDPMLVPQTKPRMSPLFTILYAGTIVTGAQDPQPFFKALEMCFALKQLNPNDVEVQFLGTPADRVERALTGTLIKLPVRVLPRVSHRDALLAQMGASVLLLLAYGPAKGIMTGKVFDYLAAGRPILAVPDDRETTAALLKRTGAGVALTDPKDIARQLIEWYHLWQADPGFSLARNESEIARYSRRAQTAELASLLDQVSTTS
jgi:glycosyltransferase involved in cell wall biosynthesis